LNQHLNHRKLLQVCLNKTLISILQLPDLSLTQNVLIIDKQLMSPRWSSKGLKMRLTARLEFLEFI